MGEHGRATMKTPTRREQRAIFRIGALAGIVGALLAMVGNLLHPATPIGDPEGVARTIAQSERWVLVHLVVVVGLILMLGALVARARWSWGGFPGVGLPASFRAGAAAAPIRCLSLFTVFIDVADEHPTRVAGAGTLEARVVRLYGVVVLLSGWVRMRCARLFGVHEAPSRGPGPGELLLSRGHF